jgi:hypothetical protein
MFESTCLRVSFLYGSAACIELIDLHRSEGLLRSSGFLRRSMSLSDSCISLSWMCAQLPSDLLSCSFRHWQSNVTPNSQGSNGVRICLELGPLLASEGANCPDMIAGLLAL